MTFPKDFLWGVATASYQIEGAAMEDGRGECIWTRFSHTPGKIKDGTSADVGNDHYHRYEEDVALMKELGVQAYRFSTSWPRVIPQGTGTINEIGLDYYDRLTDALLRAGIQPWITLYHWDLPQVLEDKGGWTNPDIVHWFTDYADLMTKTLGDRVKHWITFNEPWCSAMLGYYFGTHAPGIIDPCKGFQAAHHLLLSHGAAMPVIRRNVKDSVAGITLNLTPHLPASGDPEDVKAARYQDGFANRWYLDPVFKGEYPADMVEALVTRGYLDGIDLSAIKFAAAPMDFLGINYYMRWVHKHIPGTEDGTTSEFPKDAEFTDMGWEINGPAMADLLVRVHKEYNPQVIYVTENGAAFPEPDTVTDSILEDPRRVAFYKQYLTAAEDAINRGVPLKGYFAWSLMDNFEWAEGFSKRFGIVHVDYQSQKRTPKRSALYYSDVIRTNSLN
ncbi:MAG: GH1 family beta-glucosidase [Anaerolineae bacterium]